MGDKTGIEWTDATWNPVTGCTAISAGCDHCYAELLAYRLQKIGVGEYRNGFDVALHPAALTNPCAAKPAPLLVNSMTDLFHARPPQRDYVASKNTGRDASCPQHTFQVLTKRPERRQFDRHPAPPKCGRDIGGRRQGVVQRMDRLRRVTAPRHGFLSFEPLIGPLETWISCGIGWVIVGGESGRGHRPIDTRMGQGDLRNGLGSPVSPSSSSSGADDSQVRRAYKLDGQTWNQIPPAAHIVARIPSRA